MQLKTSLLLTALLTGLATATTLPTDDGPTPLLSLPDDTSVADLPEQTTAPTLIPSDDGDDTSEPSDTTDVPTTLVPSPTTDDDDTPTPTDATTDTITVTSNDSDSGTATTSPAETHTHDATATTTDNGTMTSSSDAADETGSGEDDDDSGRGDEDRQRTTTRAASTPTSINAAAGKSQFGLAVLGVALVAGLGL
jgi:hypothetical protein